MSLTLYSYNGHRQYEVKHPTTREELKSVLKNKDGLILSRDNLILVDRDTGRKITEENLDESIQNVEVIPRLYKSLQEITDSELANEIILFMKLIQQKPKNELESLNEYLIRKTGYCDFWITEILKYMETLKFK